MSDTINVVALPTRRGYEAVHDRVSDAYEALESTEWRLRKYLETFGEIPTARREADPTTADVGELFSFLEGVKMQLEAQRLLLESLSEGLRELDRRRLEAYD